MNKIDGMPESMSSVAAAATSSVYNKSEATHAKAAAQQADKVDVEAVEAVEAVDMETVVTNINEFVKTMQRDISFTVDKDSGKEVISVYETDTNKLIRQIPSEETLELLKNLDKLKGLLFKIEV